MEVALVPVELPVNVNVAPLAAVKLLVPDTLTALTIVPAPPPLPLPEL